jgi:hypothetical protein
MAVPPPPPPEPLLFMPPAGEVPAPPAPPPPITVTLIALTVAGFVHVAEEVYTFKTGTPVVADACTLASGNVTPGAPILVVAMLYSLTT